MYIIVGNFIDETIKDSRKLPFLNVAGNNRMLRIGQALKIAGKDVCMISPATSLRLKWTGTIFHRGYTSNYQGISINYCSAIGIPGLSSIFELILLPFSLLKIIRKKDVEGIIFYCYYGSNVISTILLRLFTKVPIIEDLEDVCKIRLDDWLPKSNINPIHQTVGWCLMKIMINCANYIIIPTTRFRKHIPSDKQTLLIDGCIDISDMYKDDSNFNEINILFSGKLDRENGLHFLLETIVKLENSYQGNNKLIFNICGRSSNDVEIKNTYLTKNKVVLKYHGFLTNNEYFKLLNLCQVCIVLQNPNGRFSYEKTPSKGYEYMGYGKALIISDIGDFSNLPGDCRLLVKPFTTDILCNLIASLDQKKINSLSNNAYNYARTNWSYNVVGDKLISFFSKKDSIYNENNI